MDIVTRPISELKPWPNNPKAHPSVQIKKIAESIKAFGFNVPLLLDQKNNILAGHGRLLAAQQLGITEVPCIYIENLSEAQARAFRIADNKVTESDWLEETLVEELSALRSEGFDIRMIGFSDKELALLLDDEKGNTEDDAVPEIPKAYVQYGERWRLGNHILVCGDATKQEDYILLLGEEQVEMVLTDPPYGVDYAAKNRFLNSMGKGNAVQEPILGDSSSPEDMKTFWLSAWQPMKNVMKESAAFYIFSADCDLMMMMMMSIQESGLLLKQSLVWVKNNIILGRRDYKAQHENLLYGWKEGAHHFYGEGGASTVWEFDKPHKSDLHPVMKPIDLLSYAIKNSSQTDECVLDPFGGSGSTLIACEKTGRKCRMMEIDPHYVSVILERWSQYTGKDPIREDGKSWKALKRELQMEE